LAILLMPLAGGSDRRAVLFALIAMTVAWLQMAITANAGGSVHHTILLWPLPQLLSEFLWPRHRRGWERRAGG